VAQDPPNTPRRLLHLDGLRGIGILLVVAGHSLGKLSANRTFGGKLAAPFDDAALGVLLLFVLSGFLITTILMRERTRTGTISLWAFYARRALRIWPALYVFIAAIVLVDIVSKTLNVTTLQTLAAALYFTSYSPAHAATNGWWFGHTWSLSVEEIFYLLWPLCLLLLPLRRAFGLAVLTILFVPVIRIVQYAAHIGPPERISDYFHTRADALAFGVVLALLPFAAPAFNARLVDAVRRYHLGAVALIGLIASAYAAAYAGYVYEIYVGWTIKALCVALLILAAESTSWLRSALSIRPLVALGLISYSLYLWQQPFLSPSWTGPILGNLGIALVLAFACAIASRHLVELPFLRLKGRFDRASPRPPAAGRPLPRLEPVSSPVLDTPVAVPTATPQSQHSPQNGHVASERGGIRAEE
jgi:peptidoglycan/LPS O-acetylase OafA/YrhL